MDIPRWSAIKKPISDTTPAATTPGNTADMSLFFFSLDSDNAEVFAGEGGRVLRSVVSSAHKACEVCIDT